MAKKSLSKLLSVILTLAICATTVFGCLMTVNAAENPSYVITGAQCNKNDTAATATVEFTVPDGMISGVFTIDNIDSWYSSVAVSLDSTLNDGDNISIDVLDGVVLFNLTDASGDSAIYSTLTFSLDFVFSTGITSDIDITLSDLDFSSLYEVNYTEFNGTNGVFSVSCEHEYAVSGDPAYTDTANGYKVYSSAVCSICGEAKEGYQVVPVVQTKEINAVSYSGKVTTVELLDSTQPNSETNPYIITDPGQIYALSRDELTYNGSAVGANHEYFKVADGIDAFYMNGGETVANLTSAAEVKTYFETNGGSTWWSNSSSTFNGNFDGNGVTIYGLYSDGVSAGLFPYSSYSSTTAAPQTIKNITVKNSYLTGSSASGAIIGAMRGNAGSTVIENCTSTNNYISSTNTSYMTGGALFGRGYGAVTVNNCLAYDNVVENSYATDYNKNVLVGYSSGSTYITNVIAIGVTPWNLTSSWSQNHIDTGNFVNIFTDQDIQPLYDFATSQNTVTNAIKYNINGNIAVADLKGVAAVTTTATLTAANKAVRDANGWAFPGADLDWENIWCYGAEGNYPSIALVNSSDADATELTSTYSGYDDDFITDEGVGSGTETDPYIISTAGQLASVCAARIKDADGNTVSTTGLYFKVADGITAFYMNGGETVAALTSAADVKSYFEANSGSTWWSSGTFNGYFDGNGATVYGIYCPVAQANSALFHTVGTEATIKNIAVKNSYFASPASGFAGGIVATTSTNSGTITIENCTVVNNYIHSAYNVNTYYGGAGAIVGCNYWGPTITIDNCLVYGNDIGNDDANTLTTSGLIGFTGNKASVIKNTIAIGVNPFIIADATNTQFNTVKAANAASVFTNVYTDMDVSVAETLYGVDYTDHITQLTRAQMQGKAAKENMSLTWGTDWYVGNRGDYPSLTPVTVSYMPADLQAQYDALELDNYDDYGDSTEEFGMYATSLNLKANPYMAFTFAFHGEYKQSADVSVTFSDGSNTIATVTAAEMVNNDGAGRYHLYRLKNAPVIALCTGITITANGTNFGTFSAEGFALEAQRANRINPCDYYATRYEAAKALLFYSQMLAERYGA